MFGQTSHLLVYMSGAATGIHVRDTHFSWAPGLSSDFYGLLKVYNNTIVGVITSVLKDIRKEYYVYFL